MQDARTAARAYTREHGEDLPEVADWTWGPDDHIAGARILSATGGDNEESR
jgi:xylulose-5-phosphate/fructose-6-phosphate phosphoketolase